MTTDYAKSLTIENYVRKAHRKRRAAFSLEPLLYSSIWIFFYCRCADCSSTNLRALQIHLEVAAYCHQIPARSFFLEITVAVCSRCFAFFRFVRRCVLYPLLRPLKNPNRFRVLAFLALIRC